MGLDSHEGSLGSSDHAAQPQRARTLVRASGHYAQYLGYACNPALADCIPLWRSSLIVLGVQEFGHFEPASSSRTGWRWGVEQTWSRSPTDPHRVRGEPARVSRAPQGADQPPRSAAQVTCALYWWNPLAWLAAARLRVEREFACDDLVLSAGVRPSSYAGDLLEVARGLGADAGAALGAIPMAENSGTEVRLQRILETGVPRRRLGVGVRAAAGGAALGLTGMLALFIAPQVDAEIQENVLRDSKSAAVEEQGPLFTSNLIVGDLFVSTEPGPFLPADEIDLVLVAQEIDRRRGELHACYQRRLLVDPELAGEVIIHAGIDRDEAVTEQCITSTTINDKELLTCVNDLLAGSSFPGAQGDKVDVSFPFVFEPTR